MDHTCHRLGCCVHYLAASAASGVERVPRSTLSCCVTFLKSLTVRITSHCKLWEPRPKAQQNREQGWLLLLLPPAGCC
jgi:hypothetical protein